MARRRAASSTRSSSCSRARSPTRRSTATATGRGWGSIPRPGSRSSPTPGSTGLPRGGGRAGAGHVRRVRRHPGDAQQPDRRDGPARLPGLELGLAAGPADRQPARLPGAAGQHHRDAAVPGPAHRAHGPRARARRAGPSRAGSSTAPSTRDATAPAWPSRGSSPSSHGDGRCLVKLGCKGPVVKCNVPIRGWINGIGGCPNVGGICMACTMPGFPDKYMPFCEPDAAATAVRENREVRARTRRQVPARAADPAHLRRRAANGASAVQR